MGERLEVTPPSALIRGGLEVSFVHIRRASNGVAYYFAKNGVKGPVFGVFHI